MSDNNFITLDQIDPNTDFAIYYCLNVKEKRYECSKQLTYRKNGGFGIGYPYCSSCYNKWFEDKKKEKEINKKLNTYLFSE